MTNSSLRILDFGNNRGIPFLDFGIQITTADIGRLIRDKATPIDLKEHYKAKLKYCNEKAKQVEGCYFSRNLFFINTETGKINIWFD